MSAMTASVPLTAVQITDADLLKQEKTNKVGEAEVLEPRGLEV